MSTVYADRSTKNPSPGVRLARNLTASAAPSLSSPAFAQYQDKFDPLARLRDQFSFPTRQAVWPKEHAVLREEMQDVTDEDREPSVYLAGNSLGLMPKSTPDLLREEFKVWAENGVLGHMDHEFGRPWVRIDEHVTDSLSRIVGAKRSEVACMGSLTGNLHTLFTAFYKPTPKRHKIMYEGKAFPSDQYAFASHVAIHDYPPSSLLPVDPLPGEYTLRTEEILKIIEEQGDSIAIICFGAIQYYSGEFFDLEKITKAGHAKGCLVAFDCAHAVGNVPLQLHDWGIDFACWCSYKYLNSGPGGIAGLFVHERWHDKRNHLAGWWGHDLTTRFAMPSTFSPLPGAAAWQFSNPSVLDVVSLLSSLRLFESAGNVLPSTMSGGHGSVKAPILAALREKSLQLTFYLETLLKSSHFYISPEKLSAMAQNGEEDAKSPKFTIITPSDPERRGAQLSLLFSPVEVMDPIFERLREGGVLGDERRPGVIRFAPVPMYNSWSDCCEAARVLEKVLLEVVREGQAGLVDLSKGGHGSAEGGNRGLGVEADDDGVRRSSEVRTR